jgi:hypothetical protein
MPFPDKKLERGDARRDCGQTRAAPVFESARWADDGARRSELGLARSLQHESDAMWKRVHDAFDWMYRESAKSARVLAFGVHPYISGAAHRIKYFDAMLAYMKKRKDIVFWQGDEIYQWYASATSGKAASTKKR